MAEVKRFSGNTTITQGTGATALSLADIIPVQPTSQGASVEDKKSTLANIKAIPYAVCATAGATAAKTATMQNFKNSTAEVGNVIKVKFNNANTADNITLTVAGHNGALKARGVQMMKGSIPAGSYIDVMWDGSAWIADTEIVEADSSAGYTKYWDGRIVYHKNVIDSHYPEPSSVYQDFINKIKTDWENYSVGISDVILNLGVFGYAHICKLNNSYGQVTITSYNLTNRGLVLLQLYNGNWAIPIVLQ